MDSLSIFPLRENAVAPAPGAIVLAKVLVYEDYGAAYGGACAGLAGAFIGWEARAVPADALWRGQGGPCPGRVFPIAMKGSGNRARRLAELADRYLDSPGGYGCLADAFALISRARLGHGGAPLAFFALAEHRRRFEAFFSLVEREGLFPESRGGLGMAYARVPAFDSARGVSYT